MSDETPTPSPPKRPAKPAPPSNPIARLGYGTFRLFSSFGLVCVILILLFILTLLGTLEQQDHSIHDVQAKYFESLFLVSDVLGVPLVLPGAYLLLSLLAINLIVGGVVRIRKRLTTTFVIVTHLGILLLLAGGLIEFYFSTKGAMEIRPGKVNNEFQSYTDWNIRIHEQIGPESRREWIVPFEALAELEGEDAGPRTFRNGDLPFDLVVERYSRNSVPSYTPTAPDAGHWRMESHPPDPAKAERNVPGAELTIRPAGKQPLPCRIWGMELLPFDFRVAGRSFQVGFERVSWKLPFGIALEEFVHRDYPGTNQPREYSSHITRVQGSLRERIHITMNDPLRQDGYTFYQSSYDVLARDEQGRPTAWSSVLAVVKNPADAIPDWAIGIIIVGLFSHFGMALINWMQREARRRQS